MRRRGLRHWHRRGDGFFELLMGFSPSQLTHLGNRLKVAVTADDLILLDEYRRSFGPACECVIHSIKTVLSLPPTARPAKSTQAIIEKLNPLSSRLGQMQDIAGCRITVDSLSDQDLAVERLREEFPDCRVEDRRLKPSHGYRAVHVIVKVDGFWVEVQIRTKLQHLWASVSEKLADVNGNSIKYGHGDSKPLAVLAELKAFIAAVEDTEAAVAAELRKLDESSERKRGLLTRLSDELLSHRNHLADRMLQMLS